LVSQIAFYKESSDVDFEMKEILTKLHKFSCILAHHHHHPIRVIVSLNAKSLTEKLLVLEEKNCVTLLTTVLTASIS